MTRVHVNDHAHHGPGHHHHHVPSSFDRSFAIGVVLNVGFVVAEVVYGLRARSLALTADAGHNLGDVLALLLALLLAWAGSVLARRDPTPRRAYGLRRFSILAAMANAGFLLIAVGAITVEAMARLRHPEPVASRMVIVVAAVGILINVGTALGFMRGREHDINLRGAFLHMMGDAAASAGVVLAGLLIGVTGWLSLDPAMSLVLVALITWASWGLAKDSFNLAMDAVPPSIDPALLPSCRRSLRRSTAWSRCTISTSGG